MPLGQQLLAITQLVGVGAAGLQKLVLQPSVRSQSQCFAKLPACLWFNPAVWADKLTHLELHGVTVQRHLPPGLAQLFGLHTLGLIDCCLRPRGVAQLLRQVVQGGLNLKVLLLQSNGLWQLPEHGWQALSGLQVGVFVSLQQLYQARIP